RGRFAAVVVAVVVVSGSWLYSLRLKCVDRAMLVGAHLGDARPDQHHAELYDAGKEQHDPEQHPDRVDVDHRRGDDRKHAEDRHAPWGDGQVTKMPRTPRMVARST